MVNSRDKGRRAETNAKEILIKHTELNWQRTPSSGALDAKHGLKGDLYIPNCKNKYCIEVKHYKEDQLTSKILTSKEATLNSWWKQTIKQSLAVNREPLLIFKYDRSKFFVGNWSNKLSHKECRYIHIHNDEFEVYKNIYIYLLEDYLEKVNDLEKEFILWE